MSFAAPRTIYVQITNPDLPASIRVWYASHMYTSHRSPEQQVEALNQAAASQSINAIYKLATHHEYLSYRSAVARELAGVACPTAEPRPADSGAASRD
jgi:hypothetical protein